MKPILILALVATAAFVVSACNLNFREEKDGGGGSQLECEAKGAITYAQIQREILEPNNCLFCHGPGDRRGDLSSYALLRAKISRVREKVLVIQDMPPGGPVSAGEANLLAQWIDNCAPEHAVDPVPTPTPTTSPSSSPSPSPSISPSPQPSPSGRPLVRWPELRARAFNKCVECHAWADNAAASRPKALKAIDRAVVRKNMPIVSLEDETPVPLSREEQDLIVHWVVDGMLD